MTVFTRVPHLKKDTITLHTRFTPVACRRCLSRRYSQRLHGKIKILVMQNGIKMTEFGWLNEKKQDTMINQPVGCCCRQG